MSKHASSQVTPREEIGAPSTPKYIDCDYVTVVHNIVSPRRGGMTESTFSCGEQNPLSPKSGYRCWFEGEMLCIEWPPTGVVTETPRSNVRQIMYRAKVAPES